MLGDKHMTLKMASMPPGNSLLLRASALSPPQYREMVYLNFSSALA
jgi:hypothetical protein